MTVTVKVNGLFNSLVHKGSIGITMSTIPDVCKTPSPAGPVPIPYPIIVSMSANLTKGTKKVKADKKMAAVKGSEFSRCMGDEPGVTGGVVSNTNMKEAAWILYSFDVKMEGKNACRLMDKMFMNHKNTVSMCGCLQPPVVGLDMDKVGETQEEACQKISNKKVHPNTEAGHQAAAKKAGMRHDDYEAMRKVAGEKNVAMSFRQTNPNGIEHLGVLPSKPMTCKKGTLDATGCTDPSDPPVFTGDYDMHDLIQLGDHGTGGSNITDSATQGKLNKTINKRLPHPKNGPRVMHGPQSSFGNWMTDNPDAVKKWETTPAEGYDNLKDKMQKKYLRPGAEPGKPVTMFDGKTNPATVYQFESPEDIENFYRCKGVDTPEHWDMQPKKKA